MPYPEDMPVPVEPRPRRKTWDGQFEIKKHYDLPGVRVRVKVVQPDEVKALGKADAVWLYDTDKDMAVVLLDGTNPVELQRYALIHETQHGLVELLDVMLEKHSEHVATRSMLRMKGVIE